MSKGKRTRDAGEIERQLVEQKAIIEKKKKRKARITTIIVSVCIIAIAAGAIGSTVVINNLSESGYFARRKAAVKTENYSMNICMMQYFYNTIVQQFANNNSSYLEQMGLDISGDLKSQTCAYDQKKSWYDYFMDSTKTQVEEILLLCEAAKADGIKLTKDDTRYLSLIEESIKTNSKNAGYTVAQYLEKSYGKWVTEEDLKDCMKLTQLATKYQTKYRASLKFDDNTISGYYNENKSDFLTCGYISYLIDYGDTTGKSDSEIKKLQSAAKKTADNIADSKSTTDFKNKLEKYIKSGLESADSSISSDDLASKAEEALTSAEVTDEKYDVTTEKGKWLFDSARKMGDTTVIEDEEGGGYYVYLMTTPAAKKTAPTVNVRHILLTTSDFSSESECEAKAKQVLKEWRNGKKTEDSFSKLATLYSSDTSSVLTGGLYENVAEGTMVESFNDWIFSTARKAGDTDIVKSDYGYHVMYFIGDGVPLWKADVISTLKNNSYNKKLEELKKKYEITEKESNISSVTQIKVDTSNSTESAVS